MDSISSVTLKRRLEVELRAPLPMTLTFEHPTPLALATYLGREVLASPEPPQAALVEEPPALLEKPAASLSTELDEMSEDELAKMLSEELASLADERGSPGAVAPS